MVACQIHTGRQLWGPHSSQRTNLGRVMAHDGWLPPLGWTTYTSGQGVTVMAGHRLTQVLQTHLDLELHLLLNADHLFRAAHLPDTLVTCLHHLEEGGHVGPGVPSYHWDQHVQKLTLTGQPHVPSSPQSGTKWDTLWVLGDNLGPCP